MKIIDSLVFKDAKRNAMQFENVHFLFCDFSQNFQNLDSVFSKLEKDCINTIFCYDYVLLERNIYYPSFFLFGLALKAKIGQESYQEYMELGGMFGILSKYNYKISHTHIHFAGAFGSCLAHKVI